MEVVIGSWNGELSVWSEAFVIDERIVFAGHHHLPGFLLEANRPIVGIGHVASPGVSVEIVNQVPAADNQNAFASQGRESLADFKVEGCRLGFVDAELHDRISASGYTCFSTDQSHDRAPCVVGFYRQGCNRLCTLRASSGSPGAGYCTR